MMMIEAGIPFTEKNFNKATWPSHKEAGINSGLYTYGQGETYLCHSRQSA